MNAADLRRLARRAWALPPDVVVRKAAAVARRRIAATAERQRDVARATFATHGPDRLERLFAEPDMLPLEESYSAACELYLGHRFDILGSGWVDASHGAIPPGLEGHRYGPQATVQADSSGHWLEGRVTRANLTEAKRRWSLVSDAYRPIDWQADLRSGHRWSSLTWFKDATYGDMPGADVKVPWELSRAHHLPQLALWAATLPAEQRDAVAREVCDQILDFSATNPPRFGCNWYVTMDVGIRVANWCLAIDLLRAAGCELDAQVEAAIARSVAEHAEFIAGNLEWFEHLRSNHYLGNIAGLAFAAAYLPASPRTDSWLSFAAAALLEELPRQFEPDGGNFEGSTAYHRLSAELMLWGIAVLRALPPQRAERIGPFDAEDFNAAVPPAVVTAAALRAPEVDAALARAAWFALDATRPDGRVVQFGDCDSGRLFKLAPILRQRSAEELVELLGNLDGWASPAGWDGALPLEEHLDVRHLAAATGALVGDAGLEAAGGTPIEAAVMRGLLGGRGGAEEAANGGKSPMSANPAQRVRVGDADDFAAALGAAAAADGLVREFQAEHGLLGGLELRGYPDFGLWVWRSPRLWLAIRCGSVGQYGAAGHVHNDQLAIELWIDGQPVVMDPGTYLYTPLPQRRNEYRSVAAHDAPRLDGGEPGLLTHGLFQIEGARPGTCEYFGARGFVGWHDGYGAGRRVTRIVELRDDVIVIHDMAQDGGRLDVGSATPQYSPGYGMRLRPGTEVLERFLGVEAGGGAVATGGSGTEAGGR